MSRPSKTKADAATPTRQLRHQSATELPAESEVSLSDRLRKANDAISSQALKQVTSRINNHQEEEDQETYRKRISCNYCLMKSKFNIKGRCVQHSVPMIRSRTNKKGELGVYRQVDVNCGSPAPQARAEATPKEQTGTLTIEQRINDILNNLDELLPQIDKPEEILKPLCQEVVLQLQKLLDREEKQVRSNLKVPFTPITKPKISKFRVLPDETPVKVNGLSKSPAIRQQPAPSPHPKQPSPLEHIRLWTNHFYSILEKHEIPEQPESNTDELLASYVRVMELKFLSQATKMQEMKRHIDELNSKLISYIEMASDNISQRQIEDDLALVEKSSCLGEDLFKSMQAHRHPTRPLMACSDELIRMLLVQANSVQGMILQLDQQNSSQQQYFT